MRKFSFRPALALKGRKFKGLRGFAGKPFHPPLTDIPVGAYIIGPVFDIVAFLMRDSSWANDLYRAGGFTLLAGAVVSVFTMLTGFADWLNTKKGTQMRRMANAHAWSMIVLTLVVLADLGLRFFGERSDAPDATIAILGAAIAGLVTLGGTIGGSMTYDFGFNVETATDNHVYHVSEHDIIHPHDDPPKESEKLGTS
ncbi:MAG TPA: DUF2231 domain-containing protein [Actinomycetota bacterium]|nr:DUF2231 domain-containing protein [Actinomycetota bacterium]